MLYNGVNELDVFSYDQINWIELIWTHCQNKSVKKARRICNIFADCLSIYSEAAEKAQLRYKVGRMIAAIDEEIKVIILSLFCCFVLYVP